jgi:uncharacterized protein YvpB
MPQPSAPPAIAGGGIPGLPTPENPADIYRDIMARTAPGGTVPLWNAPANRPALQAELNQRLTHQEALRQVLESQQATLAYKRAAAERVLKENPNLPDLVKADILAQAGGLQGFQMGSMMTPRALSQGTLGSEAPPGTVEYGTNEPVKPGTRYKVMYQPATQETIWQPIQPLTRITQTPSGGEQITDLLGGGAIAPVAGAVAPGFNRLLDTGVDSDLHKVYRTPYQILNPGELPITMGTPPSLLGKSSTTSQPGQLPTTRTTRPIPPPGGAQGGAKTPSAANGGGAPAVNPPAVDPLVKRKYDDWSQGGPVPTGKDLSAVQQYAESNHLPTPTQLSATGQKDVRSIDTVIDQIKQIQQMMQDHKMQDDDSRKYYSDYFGYRHEGKKTPLQDLWTKMNFEGIRSAAAALSGVNSRSYQIISRAFEHVPDPSASLTHLPDSPALMYGKLKSMLDMLTAGRQNIVDDEKKSGTIPSGGSITPLSAGSVPGIPGAQTYKQTASGPGGHKIGSNDGKSWFDVATGQAVQ